MAADERIGLALIGCGAFGRFCLESFSGMPGLRIAAVCDVRHTAADALADQFALPGLYDPAELFARDDVDLVHIATPPASHYELVMQALRGKHCLCEKPLAVSTSQADQMLSLADQKGLIAPVNFVLRHNAVTQAVKAVIDSGVLGEVLAARLTNCAGDTPLAAEHWFWDKDVSGGIFIEHGVHFFDLYSHWLGAGRVVGSHVEIRPGTGQEDRVTCLIHHDRGALVSHYHGFDQMSLMDRTDHRLVCEAGDMRVDGWIPLTLTVEAAVDDRAAETLAGCMPGCSVEVVDRFDAAGGRTTGRGKTRLVDRRVALTYTPQSDKQAVYAESVRGLLADQLAFIRDRTHARRVAERNGRNALGLAEAAANLAARMPR